MAKKSVKILLCLIISATLAACVFSGCAEKTEKYVADGRNESGKTETLSDNGAVLAATGGEYERDGDTIYFGTYPQTLKDESVTVGTVADSKGYYTGSDGEKYVKVTATPCKTGYKFTDNSSVTAKSDYYFKVERVKWRVMSEDDGYAVIVCRNVLAARRFGLSNGSDYYNSEVRTWLNSAFYGALFDTAQQNIIATTAVDNGEDSTGYDGNNYVSENSSDKLFLLSYAEATDSDNGFAADLTAEDENRRVLTTDYARASGACMSTDTLFYGDGWWWLRSPNYYGTDRTRYVYYNGRILDDGYVSVTNRGIVPALKIKIS